MYRVPLSDPSPSRQMRDPQMWPISVDSPVPEIPLEEDRLLEIARPISAFDTVDTAIGKEVSEDHQDSTLGMFQPEPMTPCVLSAVPFTLVDPFKRDLSGVELLGQTPFIELKSGKTL